MLGYNMFAYCNNNPTQRMDADGADFQKTEIDPTGFHSEVEEKFYFWWGRITVVATADIQIIDGCTFKFDGIQIEVTGSEIIATMPDGMTFNFEYDMFGIVENGYSKAILDDSGIGLVFDKDGFGFSLEGADAYGTTYGIEVKMDLNPIGMALNNIAGALPPVGGMHGGGPWDMHNKTLQFV